MITHLLGIALATPFITQGAQATATVFARGCPANHAGGVNDGPSANTSAPARRSQFVKSAVVATVNSYQVVRIDASAIAACVMHVVGGWNRTKAFFERKTMRPSSTSSRTISVSPVSIGVKEEHPVPAAGVGINLISLGAYRTRSRTLGPALDAIPGVMMFSASFGTTSLALHSNILLGHDTDLLTGRGIAVPGAIAVAARRSVASILPLSPPNTYPEIERRNDAYGRRITDQPDYKDSQT